MTVANDIISLSLRNGNINGIGQTPLQQDLDDGLVILNAWIEELNLERRVKVNRVVLPTFPDFTTDVPFWEPFRHVLLTSMAVRLRQIYSLPPVDLDVKLAVSALQAFNAINQQQIVPIHPGVPTGARQAVFLALRMAGRITDEQSVSDNSKDVDDAFSLLVMMLGQWQRKRWLIWNEQKLSRVSTGAKTYTIGPGMDFDTARPDKIHAAWCRIMTPVKPIYLTDDHGNYILDDQGNRITTTDNDFTTMSGPNAVDLKLTIIEAKEDWAAVTIKDLHSVPAAVFYDSAYPIGLIHFWPVPPANAYEMHLVVKATLPVPVSIDALLNLPPEYLDAVVNNLACRIIVLNGGQISPFLLGQARASLETIRMANSQIPLLSMPPFLSGHRGGDVSTWSGQGLSQAWTTGGGSVLS